ncbi:hypothetical protein M899_3324 [Bacteriovorax sp. BSW11_IV]|uniref:DUF6976 family protein n=1 Tax=Bacteriovorax sp. BSW11_IV TaxID=1353529 RepID=UPI000389DB10|nr:hypothetical protein [Bacteriovorax sp. BSW11_IV]EQC48776.1 hypothetical protein M899_3324 [Bacteriovorax sp. BSW11_IV]
MKNFYSKEEVIDLINTGKNLLIAADEALFKGLPKGNWIAGSIPYFMGDEGGACIRDKYFVTVLPTECKSVSIKQYKSNELEKITDDYPKNGVSFIIIPATSETHIKYANEIMTYPSLFNSPLVGWISGVHLDDLASVKPIIFNGATLEPSSEDAIVMHVELDDAYAAQIEIINLFKQGDGDTIEFPNDGFVIDNALVNGESVNFYDYLTSKNISLEQPLVADYSGAMINVSFQALDHEAKKVNLYAPVFQNTPYKLATQVANYEKEFTAEVNSHNVSPIYSCNCILNYLYAELEGKKTGEIKGPMTFGEIAYVLLNQTMVYVSLKKK